MRGRIHGGENAQQFTLTPTSSMACWLAVNSVTRVKTSSLSAFNLCNMYSSALLDRSLVSTSIHQPAFAPFFFVLFSIGFTRLFLPDLSHPRKTLLSMFYSPIAVGPSSIAFFLIQSLVSESITSVQAISAFVQKKPAFPSPSSSYLVCSGLISSLPNANESCLHSSRGPPPIFTDCDSLTQYV